MIPQEFESFPLFGDNAEKIKPDDPKYSAGFVPTDVLPAQWFNWFLYTMSKGYNELCQHAYEGFTKIVSTTQALAPTQVMNVVVDTASVILTLGSGPWAGYELPILVLQDTSIQYTGIGGSTFMDQVVANRKLTYTWTGSAWFCTSCPTAIGDVYIQYPDTETPAHLYGGQWNEHPYGGMFFRGQGGNAKNFTPPISVTWTSSTTFTVSAEDADKIDPNDLAIYGPQAIIIMTKNGTTMTLESAFTDYTSITELLIGRVCNIQLHNHSFTGTTHSFGHTYTDRWSPPNEIITGATNVTATMQSNGYSVPGRTAYNGTGGYILSWTDGGTVGNNGSIETRPHSITVKCWIRTA